MNPLALLPARPLIALAVAACFAATGAAAQTDDRHAAAIELARSGDHAGALAVLDRLALERPEDRSIAFDRITVLGWAGRDAEALAQAAQADLAGAPVHVLESIGRSARIVRRFDLAEAAYRRALRRDPGRVDSQIGLALLMSDRGEPAAAARLLDEAIAASPAEPALLDARGQLAGSAGDWVAALAHHQRALEIDPRRRESLRGVVRAAARLGAPRLAVDIAAKSPGLLTDVEAAALAGDASAIAIRWADVEQRIGSGDARYRWVDRALAVSEDASERLQGGTGASDVDEETRRRLADRIVALALRRRPVQAVALHDRLAALQIPVPGYAQRAVAGSLLDTRQPERAIPVYRRLLESEPEDFETAMGLFHALVEAERIAEATAHIDALAERTPRWLPPRRPNHDAVTARAAQALVRLYGDRLRDAERRSRELIAELPRNLQVREAFASTAQARGWPRLADAEFRRALAIEPDSAGLRAERVAPLLELHEFAEAEAQLRDAQLRRPDDTRVRRAADLWAAHNLRQLSVASGFGRSSGDFPAGSDDWRLQARLYGAPLDYRWRVFGQTARSAARFATGTTQWHREGLGIEWRAPALRASAAATFGSTDRAGLEAAVDWRPTDHWSLAMAGSSLTSNLPMQAWREGVRAAELTASVRYVADESRSFTIGLARLAFSDGNDRTAYWGTWYERWVSEPYWRLETVAWLGGSTNTADGRPYFNPGRDLTASVELAGEWLTWRRYERSFRQRLAVTGGSYSQQGYGSDPLVGIAYEHVWDLDRRLHLRYGVGRLLRPYDGDTTGRTYGSVGLDWRF